MDTPQKTQITASRSKFEDSPVFNYINSLSPIKPVKSIHTTQTFQSLSFSSLPSIFTSPHVSYQKESRFLRRHSDSDPSKPEFSSEDGSRITSHEGAELDIAQLYVNSSELQENFDHEVSVGQSDCVLEGSQKSLPEGEGNLHGIYQTEQSKEDAESDWENLITDSSDLLIFNSPIDTEAFKRLMETSLDCNEVHEMPMDHMGSNEDQLDYPSTLPGETVEPKEMNNNACKGMSRNPSEVVENEMVASGWHRGMRRRCLDFETVGAHRKNLTDSSSASRREQLVASKDRQQMLPGIGLHLNALAITYKDSRNVKIEVLSSPVASFQSPTTGQELNESLTLATEIEMDSTENAVELVEDVSQTSACLIAEDFSSNSPKKKRRKLEVETEGCKRCNCKKSKCLKLYCECFAAGVYCIEPCLCQECFNTPNHEDTVLATRKQIESRNPLAFAPKVIRSSVSVPEIGDDSNKTPASARHKRGCNCKKSNCLKKYCECYQGGVGCSVNCRCEGCKNVFGRKDGTAPPEAEEETVSEETKLEIPDIQEQNPSSIPMTPLSLSRPLQLPFSSKGKPPRYGSSSGTNTNQKYGKPNILRHEQNFNKQPQTVPDDDIPAILQDNYSSPATGTRTSPNSKRVSPPHRIVRSGRKLILQSIPSFPSLNPQN